MPGVPVPKVLHNEGNRAQAHATLGWSRALRSVKSGSTITTINDFLGRVMDKQMET